jgi:nicotinamidase-related amidase
VGIFFGGKMDYQLDDPMALLIIDAQNYFLNADSPAYLPDSGLILHAINKLISLAEAQNWFICATSHHAATDPENLMTQQWSRQPVDRESALFSGICLPNTTLILHKQHYSAFHDTVLAGFLSRRGIKQLVVCGVMTHLCVDTTIRQAFMLGYKSLLITDACASKSREYHDAAVLALSHGFCRALTIDELQKELENAGI